MSTVRVFRMGRGERTFRVVLALGFGGVFLSRAVADTDPLWLIFQPLVLLAIVDCFVADVKVDEDTVRLTRFLRTREFARDSVAGIVTPSYGGPRLRLRSGGTAFVPFSSMSPDLQKLQLHLSTGQSRPEGE